MEVEVRSSRRFLETSTTSDDSSDEEQCKLDDNDLRKLNSKLCTYEDNDRSLVNLIFLYSFFEFFILNAYNLLLFVLVLQEKK